MKGKYLHDLTLDQVDLISCSAEPDGSTSENTAKITSVVDDDGIEARSQHENQVCP